MKEKILIWLAWRMPHDLVYWCAIRVMTFCYGGSPDARTCAEALDAFRPPAPKLY